jgi:hypothetical protein
MAGITKCNQAIKMFTILQMIFNKIPKMCFTYWILTTNVR